jgi:hypothetical protein
MYFVESTSKVEPTGYAQDNLHDADEERLANPDLIYEFTTEIIFNIVWSKPRYKTHFLDQMED